MTEGKEIAQGYHETRIGLFPVGWKVEKIGNLISKGVILGHLDGNHGSLYPRQHDFANSGVPYISANAIENGRIAFEKAKFLTPQKAESLQKGKAQNGDVLFAHNATVGPVALLKTNKPYVVLSTTLTYYRCNPDELNNEYLKFFLESSAFVQQYERIMAQSTRNQVPITTQRDLYVALPPIEEQKGIVRALKHWDQAIALTERRIEAARQRKKGLMQRLLTGRVRFPAFEGEEWREVPLEDVAQVIMGQSPKSENYNEGRSGLPLIQGNADIQNRKTAPKVYTSEITKRCKPGDIILSVRAPVGDIALSVHNACIGRGVCAIRARKADPDFLYQMLVSIEPQWDRYAQGSTFKAINRADIRGFRLKITESREEQRRIAAVLQACDREIELLTQKLTALQRQKKGLMQRLLTGRVRVKV